jgi:hypothetical protein
MFNKLLGKLKTNKKIVYYVIIAIIVYLIYTKWYQKESFSPAPFKSPAPMTTTRRPMTTTRGPMPTTRGPMPTTRGPTTTPQIPRNIAFEEPQGSPNGYNRLISSNGFLEASDSGLVYRTTNGSVVPVLSTNSPGQGEGPFRLVMQNDRNLVVYDKNTQAIAATGTDLQPGEVYKGPYRAILTSAHTLSIVDKQKQVVWSRQLVVPTTTTRLPMASGLMAGIPKTTTTRLPMASGLMTSGSIVVPTTKRPTTIRPMTSGLMTSGSIIGS